jgi:hypothetical protein
MKLRRSIVLAAATLLSTVSVFAEEPSLHGYLRHQLAATVANAETARNVVTADVALEYRGAAVDVLINPYFDVAADTAPGVGVREAYLEYYTDFVDLRIGKQIIIWGKADGISITDIVSPKDLSNFLIPEFDELRLGVLAARANAYVGPAVVQLVYIPRFTPSVLPQPGTIWFTSIDTPIAPTVRPTPKVAEGLEDAEVYGRVRMQTSPLDLDLVGGYYWTNEPSPTIAKEFASPGVLSAITVTPEHYRQWIAGVAASSSLGPFILRAESGYVTPKRFLTRDMRDPDGYVEKQCLQSLAGTDTVVAGVDLSTQVMHQYILDSEKALVQDEHSWTATARARRSFLRERLVVDTLAYVGLDAPDGLVKIGATWSPADALSFRLEGNIFFGEEGRFGSYDDNDMIVVSARYSF